MALQNKNVLITGALMSIGEAISQKVAAEGANVALFARSKDKLQAIKADMQKDHLSSKVLFKAIELQSYEDVEKVVNETDKDFGATNILINNAGLALGAPAAFPNLKIFDIVTANSTNVNRLTFST